MHAIWSYLTETLPKEGVIGAIIGAFIGSLLTVVGTGLIEIWKIKKESKRKTKEQFLAERREGGLDLAHNMLEASRHLLGMAAAIRAYRIPHVHGRAFKALYNSMEKLFEPYLSDDTRTLIVRMGQTASNAGARDEELYKVAEYDQLPDETKKKMRQFADDAERLAGDLEGAANVIRATAHRAQMPASGA